MIGGELCTFCSICTVGSTTTVKVFEGALSGAPRNESAFEETAREGSPRELGCFRIAKERPFDFLNKLRTKGHELPARWISSPLPTVRGHCYRAGQVRIRLRWSSVTGQHGWLGQLREGRIGPHYDHYIMCILKSMI